MVTRRSRLCSDTCEENLTKNEDQLVRCFICDKVVESLKTSIVMDTKLNIPAKLSQLVGEGYAVIISEGDYLCNLCNKLIASMDELQRYLNDIMTTLGNHLDKKYGLSTVNNIKANNIKQEDIKKMAYEVHDCKMCSFSSTQKHIFDSHIMSHILESLRTTKHVINQNSVSFKCEVCSQTHSTKEECIKHMEYDKKLDSIYDENKIINTNKGLSNNEEGRLHTCNNCFLTFIDETFLAEHDCTQESDQDISECFVEESTDKINSNQSVSVVEISKQNTLNEHCSKRDSKNGKSKNVTSTSVNDLTVFNLNSNSITEQRNGNSDSSYQTFKNLIVEGVGQSNENLSNIFKIKSLGENYQNTNVINKKSENKTPADGLTNFNNVNSSKNETMFCKNKKKKLELSYITPRHDFKNLKKTSIHVCSKCKFKTSSSLELKAHFVIHHTQSMTRKQDLICSICNITFKRPGRYKRHMRVHNTSMCPLKCSYCGIQVQDKLHLRNHNIQNHASLFKKPVCELCHETFSSFQVFRKHRNEKHQGSFLYKCNSCDKSFKHRIQLRNHLEYAHRSSPKCRFCDKTIENLKKLREHEYRHIRLDSKTFQCDLCSKVFKTHSGLRFHKLRHSGKYPFFCEICGHGFVSVKMFEEHKGVHTKEDRYMCDICGKMFCYYSSYMIHRKWHDNPFPYKCNICSKKFHHTSVLAVHKRRVHTGERPYKCPFCVLSFVVSNTYKKHLCLHTQEFPYNCNNCNRGFTTKKKYATHLAKVHCDYTLLNQGPKKCEYKISLDKVE